jgi:hypothetical protein
MRSVEIVGVCWSMRGRTQYSESKRVKNSNRGVITYQSNYDLFEMYLGTA